MEILLHLTSKYKQMIAKFSPSTTVRYSELLRYSEFKILLSSGDCEWKSLVNRAPNPIS